LSYIVFCEGEKTLDIFQNAGHYESNFQTIISFKAWIISTDERRLILAEMHSVTRTVGYLVFDCKRKKKL
jgi:hypothetical protein